MKSRLLENQRYGRNKDTQVDFSYINSGVYRRKFDIITDNADVNRTLYTLAKRMLEHRAGTLYEDMYWINPYSAEVVAHETNGMIERRIEYSSNTIKTIESFPALITIHTHPNSSPPSADDFNSNYRHDYSLGIICCHNGRIFVYNASEEVDPELLTAYIRKNIAAGMDEFDAQWLALEMIKKTLISNLWRWMLMNDFETCVMENDDELIIPDKYMKMTSDELDEEIERLEKLAQERHKSAEKKSKDVSGIKFII